MGSLNAGPRRAGCGEPRPHRTPGDASPHAEADHRSRRLLASACSWRSWTRRSSTSPFRTSRASFPETELSSLSWVLNAYNIVFAAFLVAAGRIADLIGRRRVFLAGLIVFTLASGLCAIAPSATALTAFRVVQALGAALLVPSSLGLVLQAFPEDRRAHAVALLAAVGALAAGIGPSLGGLLVAAGSWRLVFLVNLPVGVVAYVLSRRQLVESREPGRRRMPDLLGALLFAIAIASLVLGDRQGRRVGLDEPADPRRRSAVALALGAVFAWRCTWHRSPIIDLGAAAKSAPSRSRTR